MKPYGPSRRRALDASAALRIFVRHPEKTFATLSTHVGHEAAWTSAEILPTLEVESIGNGIGNESGESSSRFRAEARNSTGETPLISAAGRLNAEVCGYLLDKGVNPERER